MNARSGTLSLVGIGPGAQQHATPAALAAIAEAEVVVGYTTYVKLVRHLLDGKEVVRTGMTEEIGRARAAVERARAGARVVLISSGDAGVYGMAGLVFEVLRETGWRRGDPPELRIVPGMTALNSCASLVGAPLGHDFCAVSLSDLLTPWEVIARRIEAAAAADFVVGLYNPASGRRTRQIVEAQRILRRHRAGTTPVALVKSAYRKLQRAVLTDLDSFLEHEIQMLTTVLVGSSRTFVFEGYMVTPRGYGNKYTLDGALLPGQRPGHSLRPTGTGEPPGGAAHRAGAAPGASDALRGELQPREAYPEIGERAPGAPAPDRQEVA
jgi:precorrin-3B C17-methyltransferase